MTDNRPAYEIEERFVQLNTIEEDRVGAVDTLDRLVEEMAEGRQFALLERMIMERTEAVLDRLTRLDKKLDNLDKKNNSLYQDIRRIRRNT